MKGRWRDIDKCFLEFSHVFSPLQKHFWPPPLPSKGEDSCVSMFIKLCVPSEFSIRYYMYWKLVCTMYLDVRFFVNIVQL